MRQMNEKFLLRSKHSICEKSVQELRAGKGTEGKEYAGFRAITKNPKLEDIQQIMEEIKETTDQTLLGWYQDFMEQLSKLDSEAIEDARRKAMDHD